MKIAALVVGAVAIIVTGSVVALTIFNSEQSRLIVAIVAALVGLGVVITEWVKHYNEGAELEREGVRGKRLARYLVNTVGRLLLWIGGTAVLVYAFVELL